MKIDSLDVLIGTAVLLSICIFVGMVLMLVSLGPFQASIVMAIAIAAVLCAAIVGAVLRHFFGDWL